MQSSHNQSHILPICVFLARIGSCSSEEPAATKLTPPRPQFTLVGSNTH